MSDIDRWQFLFIAMAVMAAVLIVADLIVGRCDWLRQFHAAGKARLRRYDRREAARRALRRVQ